MAHLGASYHYDYLFHFLGNLVYDGLVTEMVGLETTNVEPAQNCFPEIYLQMICFPISLMALSLLGPMGDPTTI